MWSGTHQMPLARLSKTAAETGQPPPQSILEFVSMMVALAVDRRRRAKPDGEVAGCKTFTLEIPTPKAGYPVSQSLLSLCAGPIEQLNWPLASR